MSNYEVRRKKAEDGGRISNIQHPISNYEVRLPRCARNDGERSSGYWIDSVSPANVLPGQAGTE